MATISKKTAYLLSQYKDLLQKNQIIDFYEELLQTGMFRQIGKCTEALLATGYDPLKHPQLKWVPEHYLRDSDTITDVTLGPNILVVDSYAFYQSAVQNVTMTDHVTVLGKHAFATCDIEEIRLSNNLVTIHDYCFSNTNLKRITIPKSVKDIYFDIFDYCTNLTEIVFEGDCEIFISLFEEGRNKPCTIKVPQNAENLKRHFRAAKYNPNIKVEFY